MTQPPKTRALGPDERPLVRHAERYRLVVQNDPAGNKADGQSAPAPSIDGASETVRVGSKEGNSLRLQNETVSRYHFEIEPSPNGFLLRDLGSTNGTLVDGYRVREIFLPRRAAIKAGDVDLVFEALGEEVAVELSSSDRFGDALGRSPAMREVFWTLEKVAQRDLTVLLEGESGTGKERLAEGIHLRSPRAKSRFVVFDCAAVPASLMESELLGHERGAFTGADSRRIGRFDEAAGGTPFLDELGELPLDLQPKLLRVLERREIRRVGGTQVIPVDVRIVAATNRDLPRARSIAARFAKICSIGWRWCGCGWRLCANAKRTFRCWSSTSYARRSTATRSRRGPCWRGFRRKTCKASSIIRGRGTCASCAISLSGRW